jgi:ribosomal protein L10
MALIKEQKTKQVKDIKEKISNQKSIVFVDFAKVPSQDMFALRRDLKKEGCNLKIAKRHWSETPLGSRHYFWDRIKSAIPGN